MSWDVGRFSENLEEGGNAVAAPRRGLPGHMPRRKTPCPGWCPGFGKIGFEYNLKPV